MLFLEFKIPNNEYPIVAKLEFSPSMKIEECIYNFLKTFKETNKLGNNFSPENIMEYIYYNEVEIDKKKYFEDYNFTKGDKIILSNKKINYRKNKSRVKLIIEDAIPGTEDILEPKMINISKYNKIDILNDKNKYKRSKTSEKDEKSSTETDEITNPDIEKPNSEIDEKPYLEMYEKPKIKIDEKPNLERDEKPNRKWKKIQYQYVMLVKNIKCNKRRISLIITISSFILVFVII